MGKSKFYTGVVVGAVVGGLISLLNKQTRQYAKGKYLVTKSQVSCYMRNPANTIRHARNYVNQFNDVFNKNADQAINAVEQVEQTIKKLTTEK